MGVVGGSLRHCANRQRWSAIAAVVIATASIAPVTAHADPLIYPGMEIVQGQSDNEQLTCTLGFVDPDARIGVTAGHCGGTGVVYTSDGTRIGHLAIARTNVQPEGPLSRDDYRIDYEGIVFDGGVPINNLLPNGLRLADDQNVQPTVGLPVCRIGVTTGEECGTVAGIGNGWFLVDGLPVDHGDSGSPVYTVTSPGNAAIVGIVSAKYTASRTGQQATVAVSWPTVVTQMREDLATSRQPQADSPAAPPAPTLTPPAPMMTPPPAMDPNAPAMMLPSAPNDQAPSAGPPRTFAT